MKKNMKRWLAVMLAVMTAVVFMPAMSLAVQQEDVQAAVDQDSLQKIEFKGAAPYEIYENCDGDWEEDEDGNVYYRYDEPSFRSGDQIILTDLEGNSTQYIFNEDEYVFVSVQDQDDVIDEEDVDLDCSSQEEVGCHWDTPGDYYCKMEYEGLTCNFPVSIVVSPVESVQFEPVEPIVLGEETDGEWETEEDEDGVEHEWFEYDPLEDWFRIGDKLILKYRGEDQARTYEFKQLDRYDDYGEAEDGFVNSDDPADVLDDDTLEQMDDQSYDNQWEMGSSDKNYFYLSYLGTRSEKIPVTIKKGIGSAKITAKETFKYTGKVIKPAVKVVYTDKDGNAIELKKDQDYTVDYYYAINGVGDGNYSIQGIGDYAGKVWESYDVKPLGTTLGKSKGAKKALTIKWKAQKTKMYLGGSGQKARVDGYQIMIATDKKFKKNKKKVFVKGYKKTSTKIKKLKAKKKYYVKVRTRIDGWYYSDWSKVKTVKTK